MKCRIIFLLITLFPIMVSSEEKSFFEYFTDPITIGINKVIEITDSNLIEPIMGPDACPQDRSYHHWSNCVGRYTYPNGDFYVGEWLSGMRHGQGIIEYSKPALSKNKFSSYKGRWSADRKHGKGFIKFCCNNSAENTSNLESMYGTFANDSIFYDSTKSITILYRGGEEYTLSHKAGRNHIEASKRINMPIKSSVRADFYRITNYKYDSRESIWSRSRNNPKSTGGAWSNDNPESNYYSNGFFNQPWPYYIPYFILIFLIYSYIKYLKENRIVVNKKIIHSDTNNKNIDHSQKIFRANKNIKSKNILTDKKKNDGLDDLDFDL